MAITKIAQVDVGAGGASSIAFSSIAGTYTDLMLVISARSDEAGNGTVMIARFNGDTTDANYTYRRLLGNGSSTFSATSTQLQAGFADGALPTASTFGNSSIYIPNYAGSTTKTASVDGVFENNSSTASQAIWAGSWTGTAAITSITLTAISGNNFVQYSSATLYGISKSGATGASVS
jgi:hypothetical protein